jgi:hypothetical protein
MRGAADLVDLEPARRTGDDEMEEEEEAGGEEKGEDALAAWLRLTGAASVLLDPKVTALYRENCKRIEEQGDVHAVLSGRER